MYYIHVEQCSISKSLNWKVRDSHEPLKYSNTIYLEFCGDGSIFIKRDREFSNSEVLSLISNLKSYLDSKGFSLLDIKGKKNQDECCKYILSL